MDIQTEDNAFIMRGYSGATTTKGMAESEKEKQSTECKAKERANVYENAQIKRIMGNWIFIAILKSEFDVLCRCSHSL